MSGSVGVPFGQSLGKGVAEVIWRRVKAERVRPVKREYIEGMATLVLFDWRVLNRFKKSEVGSFREEKIKWRQLKGNCSRLSNLQSSARNRRRVMRWE